MGYHPEKELAEYWRSKVNSPEFVKTEINWAQWVRTKYEALISVGFTKEEAFEITRENVSSQNINIANNTVRQGE